MRALLVARTLTIPTIGCTSTKEPKPDQAPAGSGQTASREAQDKATLVEGARGEAKTEAANAQEAAAADAAKAHKITADQLQAEFDTSDRKFTALKEKAAKATGAKKKSADAGAAEVTKREATVMASIAKLRDAAGPQWDATKTQVEADAVAFNKAVDALATTLQ